MELIKSILISLLLFLFGLMLSRNDIKYFRPEILYYKLKINSLLSYISLLIFVGLLATGFIVNGNLLIFILLMLLQLFFVNYLLIWIMHLIDSRSLYLSLFYYAGIVLLMYFIYKEFSAWAAIVNVFLFGMHFRNTELTPPYKKFVISNLLPFYKSKMIYVHNDVNSDEKDSLPSVFFDDFQKNQNSSAIQDFSYAGYYYGESSFREDIKKLTEINVINFGIRPDTESDQTDKIQTLIDETGEAGGGVLYFPAGIYNINKTSNSKFISINHSGVVIRGEIVNGENKTVFLSHRHSLIPGKNPWLSPFLFTFGEKLQKSNIFWGIQFKKKKNIVTQGTSLIDPGSDGTILSPDYCCGIIADALRGESVIQVADSGLLLNKKYIVIAMYNSSPDGNLVKEMLGVDEIPEEWKTAHRAGDEIAPSFQWLVEISHIKDKNSIVLKQPLRRDLLLKYQPEIFEVPMIIGSGMMDIHIRFKWNGIFRHHGMPVYFSRLKSQIMDYGWNAINVKRVAHGYFSNIIIEDSTNPVYVQDSRNVTVEKLLIKGNDGHQGIKIYGHACDNMFSDICIKNHYADMMGGEGNSYGNVFRNISYENPENNYADFDFHGFSEGPFNPPSYNLFENCSGFRGVKGSGTMYNQPASAIENVWWNIEGEGFDGSTEIFHNLVYDKKNTKIRKILSCSYHGVIKMLQAKKFTPDVFMTGFKFTKNKLEKISRERSEHTCLFNKSIISGYRNTYKISVAGHNRSIINNFVKAENINSMSTPGSLYQTQFNLRIKNRKF